MDFDWHDEKNEKVRAERGFGFEDAVGIFLGQIVEWQDLRQAYGEPRMIAVGEVGGRFYTVVYTDRGPGPLDHHRLALEQEGAYPMAKFSLSQALLHRPQVDEAKLDSTTEEDIRAYQKEDGFDPEFEPKAVRVVPGPRDVRVRLGLTQKEFAEALHIPLATVRNWEQGRTVPDAPARALLTVVAREPEAAFAALGTGVVPDDVDEAAKSPLSR
ncbi:BrnT family toxin [Methylobacterium sp. SyP6R]|uniref:BrnT family toxin n=1 Tax=Methylobacterium sp. SyP6R TaxID=2718876 RepID=UPI003019C29F